jgi:hypothetical protein
LICLAHKLEEIVTTDVMQRVRAVRPVVSTRKDKVQFDEEPLNPNIVKVVVYYARATSVHSLWG